MSTNNTGMVTNEEIEDSLAVVDADGGNAPVDTEELTEWKTEVEAIAKSGRYLVQARRWAAERTRFAIWDGQSPDGRKHAEAMDGKPPFPFEGASDMRLRLADMVVNERVLILAAAALRNLPTVKALDMTNQPLGAKLTTLLKWMIKNKLGSSWQREIIKLIQYQEADSPAGAVLSVWWEQSWALKLETLTLEQIEQVLSAPPEQGGYGLPPQQLHELDVQLQNPDKDADTAKLLLGLIPELTPKRAKQVVSDLRETGTTTFPRKYKRVDQPCVTAYRLYEDIFFPANTTDVTKRARMHVIREWVGEADLRARVATLGWSQEFVDEVLKHPSQSAFPEYERHEVTGEWTPVSMTEMQELHRGEYEILTVLFKAVNDDNIPGIYFIPYHQQVDFPAHDRQLLDYAHGDYPLTGFFREILGNRVLDSRGVPELVATEQYAAKMLADSFHDNVSIASLPNIKVPRRRSKLALVIKPLGIIKEDRPGDVSWMQPPQYPAGNDKQQAEIRRRVDEYFGRISETVPPLLTQLHQTGMVSQFLTNLQDAVKQMLQLCQQYMTDDQIRSVCGDDGIPVAHTIEEIQGDFNVELTFDPAMMDMENVKEIVTLIFQVILPADQLQTTQRDKIIQWALGCLSPNMAANWTRPVDAAQKGEIDDEINNLVKMQNGIEPPMVAEGINPQARLQALQQAIQANPDILKNLHAQPMNQKIFEARVEYLQNQIQQQRNAVIGRQVGKPALPAPESAGISQMQN